MTATKPPAPHAEQPLKLTFSRRRYGRTQTYCWASVEAPDGTLIDLGDPWPAVNWPKDVLQPFARALLARHAGDPTSEALHMAEYGTAYRAHLERRAA